MVCATVCAAATQFWFPEIDPDTQTITGFDLSAFVGE
jgi:hypothetical protein